MTTVRKTISISDAMEDWVKAQIASGRYSNDSEYFRDLIRRDQDRIQAEVELRTLLQRADASGISKRDVIGIMNDVESNMRADGRLPTKR